MGDTAILIDAGLGPRQLQHRLRRIGLKLADLQACFLTHEHNDHVVGLNRLSFPKIPIFTNHLTRCAVEGLYPATGKLCWEELPLGGAVQLGSLLVESFATSHDACSSVGYRLYSAEESFLFATDLGSPSAELVQAISAADAIVLEANHDVDMLRTGPYPPMLKRRVAGPRGHLSNTQTAELLQHYLTERTRCLVLAHLSRTNNIPCLALETVAAALVKRLGLHPGLQLAVAPSLASGRQTSVSF
ncbi:MAG: MBL fold metallo-hydrolase [Symbiobacteriaceae bacterium]|nr:MBL fold metallo-hydrolase [Symbiobacteriaceae bacterium]